MKLYAVTIEVLGGLGTPLKGDTIFGQFCWQVAYSPELVDGGLEDRLSVYSQQPFLVFSSAYPCFKDHDGRAKYALKKPDLPAEMVLKTEGLSRYDRLVRVKEFKKKQWLVVGDDLELRLDDQEYLDSQELLALAFPNEIATKMYFGETSLIKSFPQPHNSINRLTNSTGTGAFAPYEQESIHYYPGANLVIFALLDESCTDIERIKTGLETIGTFGFGKDASIGMGRFNITDVQEMNLPQYENANAMYCLSPCVPEKDSFANVYYTPFVRFGRHGDRMALSRNPFKNPVLMADEGAVFLPKDNSSFEKPYIGRAVTGVSKVQQSAVVQGYSIYLPLILEQ